MSLDPIIVAPVVFAGVMIASVPMVFVAVIMGALAVPLFMALIAMSAVECGLKGRGWLRTEGQRSSRPKTLAVSLPSCSHHDVELLPSPAALLPCTPTPTHLVSTTQPSSTARSYADAHTPQAAPTAKMLMCSATCSVPSCDASTPNACTPTESRPTSPLTAPQGSDQRQDAAQRPQHAATPQEQGNGNAAQPLLDGGLLGTCTELGFLGKGAFGVVHRVLVTPVSGPAFEAARKRMPVGSPATRSVFEAEVHALKESLGCANIVQMLDARTTDEYHEVLLELLKGGTLTSELRYAPRSRLPEALVKALAQDVLRGLAHLHARRLCCRDIKLDNLLTRHKGGEVVIVDLGTACRADRTGRLVNQNCCVGTPALMAPELLSRQYSTKAGGSQGKAGSGKKPRPVPISTKCDLYSLGLLLLDCTVAGAGPNDLPRVSSAPLRAFLGGLLAHNPNDRLSAAEALQHPYLAAAS